MKDGRSSDQRNLYKEEWEIGDPVRVRMALHIGEAESRDGDYVGASLNHFGRILPAGYGGQILMTLATEELIRVSQVISFGLNIQLNQPD